ncbi:hypothetical protein, partial [Escherichia coli]|uniref:hypothetical protein n=1 Tax=Escherichia coli TaxID=562 RepID=UPI002FCB864B
GNSHFSVRRWLLLQMMMSRFLFFIQYFHPVIVIMFVHTLCGSLRIPLYSITDWHRSPISDSHPFDQPGT